MVEVVQFPPQEPLPELLIGPFEVWHVAVEGRIIPRLTGRREGNRVWLTVDNRFTASFSEEDAHSAAALIAEALAIGEGYSWSGAPNKDKPFAGRAHKVDG